MARTKGSDKYSSQTRRNQILRAYKAGGISMAEIGRRFNVSREYVRQIVESDAFQAQPYYDVADLIEFLHGFGLTNTDIAAIVGVSRQTVSHWANGKRRASRMHCRMLQRKAWAFKWHPNILDNVNNPFD